MSNPDSFVHDCLIVGAGLAGLTAAGALSRRGQSVLVLEARDRVGGRIETAVLSDGTAVDLGGQWIAEAHTRLRSLLEQHHLSLVPASRGEVTVRLQGVVTTVPSRDEIEASLNPFEVADLGQGLARFRRLTERLGRDARWADSNRVWLGQLLSRWAHSNLRTPMAQQWFGRVFEGAFGLTYQHVTLAEALRRAGSGVDMESLIAVNGGVSQSRVAGGLQQLCEAMAGALGDLVQLSTVVTAIEVGDDEVRVITADGRTLRGRTAIVSLPPKLATALNFEPPLEDWRGELAQKVPAGSVVKAVAAFEQPWWREAGFSGQMGADEGPVRVLFDTSDENGAGVLTGFFGADDEPLSGRSPGGLRQLAMAQAITAAFGPGPAMVEYLERDWKAEEFTQGCHGAHFAPGVWTASGPSLAAPIGPVHFAGAEYARTFNGYAEGAVHSGEEAAAAVLQRLVWALGRVGGSG